MEIPKDAPSLRKRTLLGGIGAVLVLAVVVVVSLRSSFGAIFHEKNDALVFKTVVRGDFVEQVPAYGTLKSDVRRSVVSKVSGTVTQIIKLAGEPVKKDDVIVVLTNPQLNQEVRKAELSLKDAEAALQQTKAEIADNHLELQNTYVINQSDAKAQLAQLTAREKLAKLNIISKLELMQYQATYDKAVLAEKLAKKRLDAAASAEQAKLASAAIKAQSAQQALDNAKLNESYLAIRPGLNGRIQSLATNVELGTWIEQGTSLGIVADPDSLIAQLQVSTSDAAKVKAGDSALININGSQVSALVTRVAPNASNGQVQVDVRFDEPLPGGARSDMDVRGTITTYKMQDQLLVPRPPYYRDGDELAIYKQKPSGEWVLARVPVNRASRDFLSVSKGFAVGDKVVMNNPKDWQP
ncbi:efflux RND transporter periplasmic adaptor subunit [Gallaecimonas pentaromativorans]|uniref:efflux RND transporter periplasmic adaptor subunit n=1 Tax=Gallaecimonas pentaromativorans TaxID=584787 RepID=UPI003A92EEF2